MLDNKVLVTGLFKTFLARVLATACLYLIPQFYRTFLQMICLDLHHFVHVAYALHNIADSGVFCTYKRCM